MSPWNNWVCSKNFPLWLTGIEVLLLSKLWHLFTLSLPGSFWSNHSISYIRKVSYSASDCRLLWSSYSVQHFPPIALPPNSRCFLSPKLQSLLPRLQETTVPVSRPSSLHCYPESLCKEESWDSPHLHPQSQVLQSYTACCPISEHSCLIHFVWFSSWLWWGDKDESKTLRCYHLWTIINS